MQGNFAALASNRRTTLLLLLILVAIACLTWWIRRPRTITAEAERLTRALARGDADTLFDCVSAEEQEATGLDRPKFRAFFMELVWPRIRDFEPTGPILTEQLAGGAEGSAYWTVTDPVGRKAELQLSAFTSSEGPRVPLTPLIIGAWIFENVNRKGLPLTRDNLMMARRVGAAQDIERLRQLGITGCYDFMSPNQSIPWQKFLDAR